VGTNGLVLAARVHGADLPDRDGGRRLLAEGSGRKLPRLELVCGPTGLTRAVCASGPRSSWAGGWRCRTIATGSCGATGWRRSLAASGFCPGGRWVGERTLAWLSQVRRLSKDYERLPEMAEAMIYEAMSRIMVRRLARAA
jgi:putative transposase